LDVRNLLLDEVSDVFLNWVRLWYYDDL